MATETQYTPEAQPALEESKSSRGCLYGCLFAGVAIVLLVLCAGFGSYWFLTSQVAKWTADAPMDLPKVEYTEEQLTELNARVDAFKQTLDEGNQPEEDLVLTAEDINALINENESMQGKAFVEISDGAVKGDISFPFDGVPGGHGRYFNASGTFNVSMENGVLIVTLVDAEVKGEPVPGQFIESLRRENLAKDIYKDPKNAEMLRRFESVEIKDNQLILKVRREKEGEEPAAAEEQSTPIPDATNADTATPDTATPEPSASVPEVEAEVK